MSGRGRQAWRGRLKPIINVGYGFVSKGDLRLKDKHHQEKYYTEIVDRYMKFCGGNPDKKDGSEMKELFGHTTYAAATVTMQPKLQQQQKHQQQQSQHVSSTSAEVDAILLSMRKLREGIVASGRVDKFVQEVYIFFVRAAILLRHIESYLPALSRLLEEIHLRVPLSNSECQEFAGYYMLHLACRMEDYSAAFQVKKQYNVKDYKIDQAILALIHNNYWAFRTARRKVDLYKGRLMDTVENRIREDTLKCLGRAYKILDMDYIEVVVGMPWSEAQDEFSIGWQPDEESKKVIIQKKPQKKPEGT